MTIIHNIYLSGQDEISSGFVKMIDSGYLSKSPVCVNCCDAPHLEDASKALKTSG